MSRASRANCRGRAVQLGPRFRWEASTGRCRSTFASASSRAFSILTSCVSARSCRSMSAVRFRLKGSAPPTDNDLRAMVVGETDYTPFPC